MLPAARREGGHSRLGRARAGPQRFVELHLVVPGTMRVDRAHAICDRIEEAIGRELPGTVAVVHVEPEAELQPPPAG